VCGQLAAVVAAQVLWRASLGRGPLQRGDRLVGGDAARDEHLKCLADELLDHVWAVLEPCIGGLVELKSSAHT
jgi:hypothetical protein